MAEPLGSRFAKLWAASTTSALGSGLATIAAPLFVAAHTPNPLIVSATAGGEETRQVRGVRRELAEGFRWLAGSPAPACSSRPATTASAPCSAA